MRIDTLQLFSVLVFLLIVSGCSNHSPTAPDFTKAAVDVHSTAAQSILWGLWEVHIDSESESIEVVPLRGPAFTCNVVQFVDGPPVNLLLTIENVDIQADYSDILVDIGLQHPFPGLDQFTGFDVLGVFMGDATDLYSGPEGYAVPGENDQRLLNADGFTRWFNATEFATASEVMPLLGYYPGKLGTPYYTSLAILNPYKYFADGLGKDDDAFDFLVNNADDRGCFRPGSVNRRYYDLRFPTPSPGIAFQYAVIANWDVPENGGASLDDFPISANAAEAVVLNIVDSSTLYYIDETTNGGHLVLDLSPLDWSAECNSSGVVEEYAIKCYSDAWSGNGGVVMESTASGTNYHTFHADIPVNSLSSNDPLPVWIEVNYPDWDYSNDLGVENQAEGSLAGFFHVEIPVGDEVPAWIKVLIPNGGEEWDPCSDQEITWDSYNVSGTVFIEYSRDNFTSDVNPIADDEPNDGSFMWSGIPCTPSPSVRVRISSTDIPTVFDISDDDFTIKDYGWADTWSATRGFGVAVDGFGNVVTSGYYMGTVDFDPGPGVDEHELVGARDCFVSKVDPCGQFLWARTWGGVDWDECFGVGVDDDGNVYACGCFTGTVDFDPGPEVDEYNGGTEGVFVIKFNSSGEYQWARTWGGFGHGMAVDSDGNSYITGSYLGTVDFDPGGGVDEHTSDQYKDIFLSKFNADGDFQFARTWGGYPTDMGREVAVDDSGNIYVTGYFHGSADFDPGDGGEDFHDSNGMKDVFLNKFDSLGGFIWAETWGTSESDDGHGVDVDSQGNVYVTGDYRINSDYDIFLTKLDSDGDSQWNYTWGGSYWDYGHSVCVDYQDSVFVAGRFNKKADFDPGPDVDEHDSNGWKDCFFSKFDSTGVYQWVRTWGGSSDDSACELVLNDHGNIYVTGLFNGTADFDPGPDIDDHSDGPTFVVKFLPNGYWE